MAAFFKAGNRFLALLIRHGADLQAKDSHGWTPSDFASVFGTREFAAQFIEYSANLNAEGSHDRTSLRAVTSACGSTREIAAELIERPNTYIGGGWASLHMAAVINSREEVASELTEDGTDLNVKDNRGWTPLHVAAFFNTPEAAAELIARGADVRARDDFGNTPLHEAAPSNAHETVAELIASGADLNAEDNLTVAGESTRVRSST